MGAWVHNQRSEYKKYQETGKAKITPERVAQLEGIGFYWDSLAAKWNQMFAELKEFKQANGHFNVPRSCNRDRKLYDWIREKRRRGPMTADRREQLNEIGFM